jgi:hypothetical protein
MDIASQLTGSTNSGNRLRHRHHPSRLPSSLGVPGSSVPCRITAAASPRFIEMIQSG